MKDNFFQKLCGIFGGHYWDYYRGLSLEMDRCLKCGKHIFHKTPTGD